MKAGGSCQQTVQESPGAASCPGERWIIAGGPGAGKTTLIQELRRRGIVCVDEVGRQITREQFASGGNAHHYGDRGKYLELMLCRSIDDFRRVADYAGPVFFDRGIPDLIGYAGLIGLAESPSLWQAVRRFRYSSPVFIARPWREIFVNDAERRQDFREAVETCERIAAGYLTAGYKLIDLPRAAAAARADFVLERISETMGSAHRTP
jgi:predicted ATPase